MEVICPQCGRLAQLGYAISIQAYVGTCPRCHSEITAVENGCNGLMVICDAPKEETWRDRAIRDPMM
jgi:hypothetical protein